MKGNYQFILFNIIILFVLILSSSVFAIIMTPAGKDIVYEGEKDETCGFSIKTNEDAILSFRVEGDLKDFVNFTYITAKVKEDIWYPIDCRIKIPKNLAPGPHEASIITVEGESPGGVGAVAGLLFPVRIFVPYPGKYLEIQKFEFNDKISIDEKAQFYVKVI